MSNPEIISELSDIWKAKGMHLSRIPNPDNIGMFWTPQTLSSVFLPAGSSTRKVLWYGNYCGPGTSSTNNPVDALDCMCKAHDFYFDNEQSDQALQQSVRLLKNRGLIQSNSAQKYVQKINSNGFCIASRLWRSKILVSLLVFITMLSALLIVTLL